MRETAVGNLSGTELGQGAEDLGRGRRSSRRGGGGAAILARLDEEFAKESFSRAFTRLGISEPAIWAEGTEPPDFFLVLGAERYAVEVTRIVGQVELDGRRESKRRSSAMLQRFATELQDTARKQGNLHGAYVLWLEPIHDFKKVAPQARLAVLDYVSKTKHLPKAPGETILKRSGLHWSITKFHDKKTYLLPTSSEGTGGLLSEVVKDFPDLLRSALEVKAAKLAALKMPLILLLVDDYHYANEQLWRNEVLVPFHQTFHTVARVFQEYECQILLSANSAWTAKPELSALTRADLGA
jgi:hypothetical protein